MFLEYAQKTAAMITDMALRQEKQANTAAAWIAESVCNGGIIHLFGCGHSHLLAEELFYRAGGLACINPILIEELMLHKGAIRSSGHERQNDFIHSMLPQFDIRKTDVVIVISTSGINPVPIDVLLYAKKQGVKTIAVTSMDYTAKAVSRHKQSLKLHEPADLVLDNAAPFGDAVMKLEASPISFTPVSTVTGAVLLNGIIAASIEKMAAAGVSPPVFLSGNTPNADEYNNRLIEVYKDRIPLLS